LYHDIEEGPNDGKDQQNIPNAMECVVPSCISPTWDNFKCEYLLVAKGIT
jgi:hypothetical protein